MPDQDLGLAQAIESVRAELRAAQDQGAGSDVRFAVGPVEVEFAVEVEKKGGGQIAIKVLNLVSLGGSGEVSKGDTNRVKVVLNPVGTDGKPFEVASPGHRRPDQRPPTGGGSGASGAAAPSAPEGDAGLAGRPDAES